MPSTNSLGTSIPQSSNRKPSLTPVRTSIPPNPSLITPQSPTTSGAPAVQTPEADTIKRFPFWEQDYSLNSKQPIGSGVWSDVYLATPLPTQDKNTAKEEDAAMMTPPTTPTFPKPTPSPPALYAIKTPATRSAHKVLEHEARILTHLSQTPSSATYFVTFHGLDTRTGSLVMRAYSTDLESWTRSINKLPEPQRLDAVASLFTSSIVANLLRGLEVLGDLGIVHGDIKPGNILLITDPENNLHVQQAVIADFSSSTLPSTSIPSAPLGGGTWDFLSPALLRKPPSPPSNATDLYALALTILYVVLGGSVFDAAGTNVFLRREMVKMGSPLQFLQGDKAEGRVRGVEERLGFGVRVWLERVLGKGDGIRVGEWRGLMG